LLVGGGVASTQRSMALTRRSNTRVELLMAGSASLYPPYPWAIAGNCIPLKRTPPVIWH
jgi:hypothetical protein